MLQAGGVLLGDAGHHEDGNRPRRGIFFQGFGHVGPAHFGHQHAQEDEIGELPSSEAEGFVAIAGAANGEAGTLGWRRGKDGPIRILLYCLFSRSSIG